MYDVVGAHRRALLPADRPRYLMGAGTPDDLVESRRARRRPVRLRAADAQRAQRPALHERRAASTSRTRGTPRTTGRPIRSAAATRAGRFSRAYLRHLFVAGEMTAATLNTLHNLHFYLDTMQAD